MVCLYSCFVKNRIKLRARVSRLVFCLLLCLCGLACPFVVAVWSISSVRLLCLALLLLRGLVRLLFYCGLLSVAQVCVPLVVVLVLSSLLAYFFLFFFLLFLLAVVFVLSSLLACLLCFAFCLPLWFVLLFRFVFCLLLWVALRFGFAFRLFYCE